MFAPPSFIGAFTFMAVILQLSDACMELEFRRLHMKIGGLALQL